MAVTSVQTYIVQYKVGQKLSTERAGRKGRDDLDEHLQWMAVIHIAVEWICVPCVRDMPAQSWRECSSTGWPHLEQPLGGEVEGVPRNWWDTRVEQHGLYPRDRRRLRQIRELSVSLWLVERSGAGRLARDATVPGTYTSRPD